jgi:hypothetical protein
MTEEALTVLDEIAAHVRSDVFRLEEAIGLLQMIAANAAHINASDFGPFLGTIQVMLQEQITLLLFKIFEKPGRFRLNSIPAMVRWITDNEKSFAQIESKNDTVIGLLEKLGCKNVANGDSITELFLKHWADQLGSIKLAREHIEALRNKDTAHHERIEVNSLAEIPLADVRAMLEQAKLFLSVVEAAYLGKTTVDRGLRYLATSESRTASMCLKELLVRAKVIDARKGRAISRALFANE